MGRSPFALAMVALLGLLTPWMARAAPYGATYAPAPLSCMTPGQARLVNVKVTNTGTNDWVPDGATPYHLAYHWYQGSTLVDYEGVRTSLPHGVGNVNSALQNSVTVSASVVAPVTSGTYNIRWDMVHELVTWFSTQGVSTFNQTVEVKASCPSLADLCLHVNCVPLSPKIDRIIPFISQSTPGGYLAIGGSGFGESEGQVWIRGMKRWHGGAYGDVPLQIDHPPDEDLWKPKLILARIPADLGGVKNQRVKIQVKTAGGAQSNLLEIDFTAAREARVLLFNDPAVRLVHCGTESTLDTCNGWRDPDDDEAPVPFNPVHTTPFWNYITICGQTIRGWHSNYWSGTDGDNDRYEIQLANGWTLEGSQWTMIPSSEGEAGADAPGGFVQGASGWKVKIPYFVTYQDDVCYGVDVTISGPRGVPWS